MNVLFFKDLVDKMWCGFCGWVEVGCFGGGNFYGYDVVCQMGFDGEFDCGEWIINKMEVVIIQCIFKDYVLGKFLRVIVKVLNVEGINVFIGKGWGLSIINGNCRCGIGIFNNEFYIGWFVWNWLCYIKDFEIGKWVFRFNLEEVWVVQDVLYFRIINYEFW